MQWFVVTMASLSAGFVDAIVGGGGLISGIAAYVKYLRPSVKVIGVEPQDSNCLQAAMAAGERVVIGLPTGADLALALYAVARARREAAAAATK